jgi:hypothetical protein
MPAKRTWTLPEIADLCGISERHAFRLAAEGILPGKDGRYDPLDCARRFIAHAAKDQEGKRARTELAKVEARRKTLLMRRQLGELLTMKERETLDNGIFEGAWIAWQLAAATFFAALGEIEGLDPRERLRIANIADAAGKGELIAFRDNWRQIQKDVAAHLRDRDRIDRMIGELSAGAADGAPAGDAQGEPGEGGDDDGQ